MDNIKKVASDASEQIAKGASTVGEGAKQGLAAVAGGLSSALDEGNKALERSKTELDKYLDWYKQREQEALAAVKEGMAVASANPSVSYPAAAAAVLLIVPGTRRMLYRATFGRFVNPEAVVASAESRLTGLGTKMEEYGAEAQKLQVQAAAAEDEWRRSHQRLRTTRSELQRLSSQVAKSERQARSVLDTLRLHKRVPNAVELRADAAQKAAALKQQRVALEKGVYRIARLDI